MAQFLQLTLPEANLNDEESKISQNDFCICCLNKNKPFISLTNCKHILFLETLMDLKIEPSNVICRSCHNVLLKVEAFKIQVQYSNSILNGQQVSSKPLTSYNNLNYSKIELNSTINSEPIEFESKDNSLTTISVKPEFETKVKIEYDSTDYEDIPIFVIKNKKNKKVREKRTPLQKKYDGKIKITVLNMAEMLQDRKEESMKKSYVSLPYKCEYCITAFDHEATYKDHMVKRHEKRTTGFTCEICKSILSTKTSYDEHYKRHFRRYECVECGKRNNNVYSVLKHYNDNHGKIGPQFSCNLCDYTTDSHRAFRYHKDKHRSGKVECEKCGNTFVNNAGLRNHMFTIHGQSSRIYSCEQCGKVYKAKSGLAVHLAKHAPHAPAYCVPCDAHFANESGLKHHLKTHSRHISDSDKRFICNECDAKFLTKSALVEHIDWAHLNKTKHACNKCSKVFKNKSSLNKHRDFVHEKKRLPRNKICDYCGRGFTSLSILQSHVRTHTGERPLRCARCDATFAHHASLYTHTKLLHSK